MKEQCLAQMFYPFAKSIDFLNGNIMFENSSKLIYFISVKKSNAVYHQSLLSMNYVIYRYSEKTKKKILL